MTLKLVAAAALAWACFGVGTFARAQQAAVHADVVVYGGTSGGVTAAVAAARAGKTVVLIEPTQRLGGLTSGGLGWTDSGHAETVGGLSREFYHRIYKHYLRPGAWVQVEREKFANSPGQHTKAVNAEWEVMWVFEPKVAAQVFEEMAKEKGITLKRGERLDLQRGVVKAGTSIQTIRMEGGAEYSAKVFIDATYEGDLLAKAGVSYVTGREANSQYGETINGIQTARAVKNQLPKGIDPYIMKGDKNSGLLRGVNADAGGPDGAGDSKIQAYCYRMTLTDVPENRVMIEKPAGYDERDYELLFRAIEAGQKDRFFKLDMMPNRKTDSNNDSGLSTDLIGENYDYPEGDYATREKIAARHEAWQRGLVWSLQNHPRVPEELRKKYARWGLPKDEYVDNRNWSPQLYVREARRMVGASVATEKTLFNDALVKQSIGLGSYAMDSHNVQRHVTPGGFVLNEGDVQIKPKGPYAIDYGVITPKATECTNLLVPVCVSASHIAYGSIRMEPVFMILGHSAGTAAALAIDTGTSVQSVEYSKLEAKLKAQGQVLRWTK